MSLVCIFDRVYEIAEKKDIQRKLAELIYLPHIHNVFVDTDSTKPATIIGAESASSNTKLQIYARHIHPNVLTDKQDALKQYLVSEELKDTIKVYVARTKDTMNELLERTTGTVGFDHKNTVYILCNTQSLMNLISVLQTMEFKAGDYLSKVTTDTIHPILKQILAQSNELNVKVQTQIGGSDSPGSETQQLLKHSTEIEPAPPVEQQVAVDSNRLPNVVEPQEPAVLGQPTRITTRAQTRTTSKKSKLYKSRLVIISGKAFGTIKQIPGDAIYIIAPDESVLETSNIFKSLVKFFMVKPNSSVKSKNIEKNKSELPAKLEPKKLSGEVEKHGDDAIIKMGAKKAKQALPRAKRNVEHYKSVLKKYKLEFEKAKNDFLKDPENMRVYKKYILPVSKKTTNKLDMLTAIIDNYLELNKTELDENLIAELNNMIRLLNTEKSEPSPSHQDSNGALIQPKDEIYRYIKQNHYECVNNASGFTCAIPKITYIKVNHTNIEDKTLLTYQNKKEALDKIAGFSSKLYDFTLILKYINFHDYYNSNIIHLAEIVDLGGAKVSAIKNVKTMKKINLEVPTRQGQIVPDKSARNKTMQQLLKNTTQETGITGDLSNVIRRLAQKNQEYTANKGIKPRKGAIKHAWAMRFGSPGYKAARQKSEELKKEIATLEKTQDLVVTPARS